jgi:23S rRNA pseudouridine2605 synthase
MEERLQKILSRAGVASRRKAEDLLTQGRIQVNGVVVTEAGTKADVERDDVRVDGVRVRAPQAHVYLALNKPRGVVSTRKDPGRRATVMDCVPPVAGLFPIGRLDLTTEGLILLTNDGAFAEQVAHPRYEVARVYLAKVHGVPAPATLERLRAGVRVEHERLKVDKVRVLKADNNAWVEVQLHEGKHHEVRRLMEAVGHPVAKLKRLAIGPVTVRGLKPGEYRALTPVEIEGLRRADPPPDIALPKPVARSRPKPPRAPHDGGGFKGRPSAGRDAAQRGQREDAAGRPGAHGPRRKPPVGSAGDAHAGRGSGEATRDAWRGRDERDGERRFEPRGSGARAARAADFRRRAAGRRRPEAAGGARRRPRSR